MSFFSSAEESPWQWFYGYHIPMMPLVLLCIFPFLTFPVFRTTKKTLWIFVFCILFRTTSVFSQVWKPFNYSPTRYVYYLFPIFCLLFGTSLWILSKFFESNTNGKRNFFFFFSVFFIQQHYDMPFFQHKHMKNRIKKLMIDNIGIGRYEVEAVAEFIKKISWTPKFHLSWMENIMNIFYCSNILLIRIESSKDQKDGHTTLEKSFYRSFFFWISPTQKQLLQKEFGYFITGEHCLTRNGFSCWYSFEDRNFFYKGRELRFLQKYKWYSESTHGARHFEQKADGFSQKIPITFVWWRRKIHNERWEKSQKKPKDTTK